MNAPAKKPSPLLQAFTIVGVVLGAVVGRVVGLPVLIVGFFTVVVGVPMYLVTAGPHRRMVPAGAVQAGHALWMLLGGILLAVGAVRGVSVHSSIFVESSLLLLASLLLVCWPELPMIIVLTVYQSGAFISNLVSLNAEQAPFEVAKALLLHICLRAVALVLMYQAYFRKPEESNGEDPTLQKPRLLSEIIRQKNAVDGRERVNNVRTREEPPPE